MRDNVLSVVYYKLLSKKENKKGVSLVFEKTEEFADETWEPKPFLTGWEKFCSAVFGAKHGRWGHELRTETSGIEVFYPKPYGTFPLIADMCYTNGDRVSYDLREKFCRLVEMSEFREEPGQNFGVVDG